MFQFHNGTINTNCIPIPTPLVSRFNSTTVQLIPSAPVGILAFILMFQFHNGTINTLNLRVIVPRLDLVSIPQRYN